MFKSLFKRSTPPPAASKPAQAVSEPEGGIMERRKFPRPLPVPEVLEGDGGEADWALWSELSQLSQEQKKI